MTWDEGFDSLAELDPRFSAAYDDLAGVPRRSGVLTPKVVALLVVAVNASPTHLFAPALRQAVDEALEAGATPEELCEVLELVSALGMHACTVGVPVLFEVLESAGREVELPAITAEHERLQADFVAARDYWSERWGRFLRLDPSFFAAYLEFSSIPWRTGPLAPKVKEFVYIAADASVTHLHVPGLRQHMHNALAHGATPEEILTVLEITSHVGIHSCVVGMPIVAQALRSRSETEVNR